MGRQLQLHAHDVVREFFQRIHAHRHFLDGEGVGASHLARLQHHVAGGGGAAGEDQACGQFRLAECVFGIGIVRDLAAELFAFAGTAGTVFAAIGQAYTGVNGSRQNGFLAGGRKLAATGLNGDLKGGGVHILAILGSFLVCTCRRGSVKCLAHKWQWAAAAARCMKLGFLNFACKPIPSARFACAFSPSSRTHCGLRGCGPASGA